MQENKSPMQQLAGDLVQTMMRAPQIIEDSTVYTTCLVDTGRYYETMYSGKNKELVEKYAKERCDATDKMRSPSLSCGGRAMPYRDGFQVTLKCYGLD